MKRSIPLSRRLLGSPRALLGWLGRHPVGPLLVALWLRLRTITHQPLSDAEVTNYWLSTWAGREVSAADRAACDPLAYLRLSGWMGALFGPSEAAQRAPSLVAGVASVLLIHRLGRALYSDREAILAAWLMAVLELPIRMSVDATSHSVGVFLALATTLLLVRVLQSPNDERPPRWLLPVQVVLGFYLARMHYKGAFLLVLQALVLGAHIALRAQRKASFWFTAYGLVWAAVVVLTTASYPPLLSAGARMPPSELAMLTNDSVATAAVFATLVAAALVRWIHSPATTSVWAGKRSTALLSFLAGVPITFALFGFTSSLRAGWWSDFRVGTGTDMGAPSWLDDFALASPFGYLLVARAGCLVFPGAQELTLAGRALVVGLLAVLLQASNFFNRVVVADHRSAAERILDRERPRETSLVVVSGVPRESLDYSFLRHGSDKRVDVTSMFGGGTARLAKAIDAMHPQRVWLLRGTKQGQDTGAGIIDLLKTHGTLDESIGFEGLALLSFRMRGDRSIQDSEDLHPWRPGETVAVEITLLPEDHLRLACSADQTLGDLECAFSEDGQVRHPGQIAWSEPSTLVPYWTTDGRRLLAAGLWLEKAVNAGARAGRQASQAAGARAKDPGRFAVRCKYEVRGTVERLGVRWQPSTAFQSFAQWPAGVVSDCTLSRPPKLPSKGGEAPGQGP